VSALKQVHDADRRRVRFGALDLQHEPIKQELRAAFDRVLASSAFILGAEVEDFEAEFADYCGVQHCVGVSSGTAALTLLLRAYNIGPGDEVIVPAHTFIASALAVAYVGATPVLCDVTEDTGLIDPACARSVTGPRTAAILAVHLYGQVCDMDALAEIASPRGIILLEDAAQAAGSHSRGRRAGSLGAAAGFSFYPGKNLGGLGDGGAICTDDALLATRLRRLRNIGQRSKGEHVELGYNERLDGLQAALLRVKLPYLNQWNDARRHHADRYRALLAQTARLPVERPDTPCTYHVFAARFADRDHVAQILRDAGVETGVHYSKPVHGHEAFNTLPHGSLPVAEAWAAEELSLPMHPDLTDSEIEQVADAIQLALSTRPRN
jgi:dTDP-3-amino-3,4,6-trideoxy-alpha-D-glucose transaminase